MGKNGLSAGSAYRKPLSLKQPRQVCKKGSNIGARTAGTDTAGKENVSRSLNDGSRKVADKDQRKGGAEQKYSTVVDREEHRRRIEAAVAAYHAERMATIPLSNSCHRTENSDETRAIKPLHTTTQKPTTCRSSSLWFVFSVSLVVAVMAWSALRVIMLQRPAHAVYAAHSVANSELLQGVGDVEINRWVALPEEPLVVPRMLLPAEEASVSDEAGEIIAAIVRETPQRVERVVDQSLLLVPKPAGNKVGQQFQMVAVKFRAALGPFRRAVERVKSAAAQWMHRVLSLFKRRP
jgi:hypothetical protein